MAARPPKRHRSHTLAQTMRQAESIGATRGSLYSATLEFTSRTKEQAWVLARAPQATGVIRMDRAGSKWKTIKQFPAWNEAKAAMRKGTLEGKWE